MRKKIDWGKIKSEYVTGYSVTLKELAEKYDLSFGYLQRKSANNGWTSSRLEYRSRVEKKVEEELAMDAASERAKLIRIGRALIAIGLEGIAGDNPRLKPKNFKDVLSSVKVGAKIVSDNLPKMGNDGASMSVGSQRTLKDLKEALETPPKDDK